MPTNWNQYFLIRGVVLKTYGDAFAEFSFQGMEMQSLEKWETISVLVTQNVFGNNSRKKLDFEIGGGYGESFRKRMRLAKDAVHCLKLNNSS